MALIDMDFIIHPLCLFVAGGWKREKGTIVMGFPCLLPRFSRSHMFLCASWTYRTGYHGSGSGSGFGAGVLVLVWSAVCCF
jgi:hypothetical protein